MQTTDKATEPTKSFFRLKVTRRNTVTLPAELRRELEIEDGDFIDVRIEGSRAVIHKSSWPEQDVRYGRGLLRDYFKDHDDVMRFLDEERNGGTERDAQLEARVARMEGILADLYPTKEDVQQFIEDERRGWAERDAKLEERWKEGEQLQDPDTTSTG